MCACVCISKGIPLKCQAAIETPGEKAGRAVTDPCGKHQNCKAAALILSENT